jgi:hypothetical protein
MQAGSTFLGRTPSLVFGFVASVCLVEGHVLRYAYDGSPALCPARHRTPFSPRAITWSQFLGRMKVSKSLGHSDAYHSRSDSSINLKYL